MNMRLIITLIYLLPSLLLAQTKLSGTVNDPKGNPLPGVNVFIKDTYDGATTDINGHFNFSTDETGKHVLTMSMIGFENLEKEIELNGTEITINTKLKEKANELNTVTVTAGSFEASDASSVGYCYNSRCSRRYLRSLTNFARHATDWRNGRFVCARW